jgi:SAM-dependent methyltransferase
MTAHQPISGGQILMDPFFTTDHGFPMVYLALEDILPRDTTRPSVQARAVYQHYVKTLAARPSDDDLRPFREKALMGSLTPPDFAQMHTLFTTMKSQAQYAGTRRPRQHTLAAYAQLNSYAMLLAQILFVDNSIKERLRDLIQDAARDRVVDSLSASIRARSAANGEALVPTDARFYATLFLLQTAFDQLFVPDDDIVTYDTASGTYNVTDRYDHCIRYLALSGRKIATASRAEHNLCYDLTTGWGDHIDRATWDALNTHYYSAISPTTGEANLFATHYDRLLERMLPQFVLAKVRLAEDVLRVKHADAPLKILDIGAGSGALAIDLVMACTRLGLSPAEITYEGLDPSAYMRRNFRANCERKIGSTPFPHHWMLRKGSIEQVDADPTHYLHAGIPTVVVFSESLHHCFHASVKRFFRNRVIKQLAHAVFVLDATAAHGWTKPYYMWADCESPENFDNIVDPGIWTSQTLWHEPPRALDAHAVDDTWCYLQMRT